MQVAIYVRCSTDLQDESIAVQLQLCREYSTQHNHTIVAEYIDDGVSGGLECSKRPGASQMLVDARAKQFQGIVARSSRRLGRDTIDLLVIRKESKKIKLSLLFTTQEFGDDAQGDFMFSLMASVGELERKLTGERVRGHNRHLAKLGRWPSGRPPLGYHYDTKTKLLSVDADLAPNAVALFETFLAAAGNRSRTARMLNAQGIKTRDGNTWSDDLVADTIRCSLYRGIIKYMDVQTPIDIERVVPVHLVQQVDTLLDNTKFLFIRSGQRVYPFSGLLICSQCGCSYKVSRNARANSFIYVCRGRKDKGICTASAAGSQTVDRLVGQGIETALQAHLGALREAMGDVDVSKDVEAMRIAQKTRSLRDTREKLIDLYASNIITKANLETRLAVVDAQIIDAPQSKQVQMDPDDIITRLRDWDVSWRSMSDQDKRSLLLGFVQRIYVSRDESNGLVLTIDTCLSVGTIEVSERS